MLRQWSITICTAVATATVLLVAGILLVPADEGRDAEAAIAAVAAAAQAARERAAAGGATSTQSSPSTAKSGPEGVPVPGGRPLGPAATPLTTKRRSGIPCGSTEQLSYHVHAYVAVFVKGKPRKVPLGIGIGGPRQVTHSAAGEFVSGGSCFSYLHTHSSDGIIHIEAPVQTAFTLGQLFDVWGERLDRAHLGRTRGRVIAYVQGKRFRGNPRRIILTRHTQVQLSVGGRGEKPKQIEFPAGL